MKRILIPVITSLFVGGVLVGCDTPTPERKVKDAKITSVADCKTRYTENRFVKYEVNGIPGKGYVYSSTCERINVGDTASFKQTPGNRIEDYKTKGIDY